MDTLIPAIKPSLVSMPYEVLSIIVARPHFDSFGNATETSKSEAVLLALVQICRRLREFALPRVWYRVWVPTVARLGQLWELFRASPSLAQHVKDFSFTWYMGGSIWTRNYPAEKGSLLDLAFCDRFEVWDKLRQELGGAERQLRWSSLSPPGIFFMHEGTEYYAPGRCSKIRSEGASLYESESDSPNESESDSVDESESDSPYLHSKPYSPEYDVQARTEDADGPDGKGEDKIIKAPEQLVECVNEIVGKLTSLEKFAWTTPVLPMPSAVFQALAGLPNLISLSVVLTKAKARGEVKSIPLWQLASKLRFLNISFNWEISSGTRTEDIGEQSEADLINFELPKALPADTKDLHELFLAIACRTIITAAKGGHLRRLVMSEASRLPHLFAVRALLPYWVQLEQPDRLYWHGPWQLAADTLRPFLAHASLWLGVEAWGVARADRTFTRQEVQMLNACFKGSAMPRLVRDLGEDQPIVRYLEWLEQDEDLAQKVADAWNAVEARGEADKAMCNCFIGGRGWLSCRPNASVMRL